jgi:hypothetical protein
MFDSELCAASIPSLPANLLNNFLLDFLYVCVYYVEEINKVRCLFLKYDLLCYIKIVKWEPR